MKVEMTPRLAPRRGSAPREGNVYATLRGHYYKVVMGIVPRQGNSPWRNVVMLHVAATGDVVGASCMPEAYVKDHQDLVGRVAKLPSIKIEWLKEGEKQ